MVDIFEQRAALQQGRQAPSIDPFKERQVQKEQEEPWWKSTLRYAAQVPLGIAATTGPGLASGLWDIMATGDVLDPEEIERIREISEREGIPFDEEKYREAAETALGAIPTVSNLSEKAEKATGIPLTPKTRGQKALRFATEATRLAPENSTIRGMKTALPKPVLGAAVEGTKEALVEAGVPEPVAELASFGVLKQLPEGSPSISVGKKTKPSGLTERQYEKLEKPVEVSEKKIKGINEAVEKEFKELSDKIIEKSPIKETYTAMKEDSTFKKESSKAFEKVNDLAEHIPDKFSTKEVKTKLVDKFLKPKGTGLTPSEYELAHKKFIGQAIKNTPVQEMTAKDLVAQYRKNNKAFGELREPGQSSAYNRGKKQALLDYNKVIAETIQEKFPNSEFSTLFKESNEKWQKIMDVEAIDGFMGDLFDGKIQYKKGAKLLEKEGMQFPFKRALGKEGYKDFEQLLSDLMETESANRMMKVAKNKGFGEFAKTGLSYIVHPNIAYTQAGIGIAKSAYKKLWESLLDKPQLAFKWDKGVQSFKKGDFAKAETIFNEIKQESAIKPSEIHEPAKTKPTANASQNPIEGKAERIKPKLKEIEQSSGEKKSLPKIGEPKLVEYKPRPIEQRTIKEKAESIARQSFDDAISGQNISRPEKKILKNTQVSLLQTRQKGQQFHGTGKPIKELDPDIYSKGSDYNIYGQGFYTTDALDIADGYSKAKWAKEPTVYSVKETKPQKLYDAEQPIEEFKKWYLEDEKKSFENMKEKYKDNKYKYYDKYKGTFEEYMKNSDSSLNEIFIDEKPESVRDFYDKIREYVTNEGLPTYEFQELISNIQNMLEKRGYEGITHKGGILTDNPEHHVKIYWKPENLEIQEFSYPKEFKKVQKVKNRTKD